MDKDGAGHRVHLQNGPILLPDEQGVPIRGDRVEIGIGRGGDAPDVVGDGLGDPIRDVRAERVEAIQCVSRIKRLVRRITGVNRIERHFAHNARNTRGHEGKGDDGCENLCSRTLTSPLPLG